MTTRGLSTLIRLARSRIDELRRDMVKLEAHKATLEQRIRELDMEMEREVKLAEKQPEMGGFFGGFAGRIRKSKEQTFAAIARVDQDIGKLNDKIAVEFSELKKYEIAKEQRLAAQRAKEEKAESDQLDEVAIIAYGRKEE